MIAHIDNLIRHLLITRIDGIDDDSQVRFEPPDDKWRQAVGSQQKLMLNVYLIDLRENRQLRTVDRAYHIQNGQMSAEPAAARADLHYLITAWSPATPGADVEPTIDEHGLLYNVAAALLDKQPLVAQHVYGDPLPPDFPTSIAAAQLPTVILPTDGFVKYAEFWGTMGTSHPWRPAIYLKVTIPIEFGSAATTPLMTTRITEYQAGDFSAPDVLIDFAGTVLQANGVAVEDAEVRLEGPGTGALRQAVTTAGDGRYTFRRVVAGDYTIRVRAGGFAERMLQVTVPGDSDDFMITLA